MVTETTVGGARLDDAQADALAELLAQAAGWSGSSTHRAVHSFGVAERMSALGLASAHDYLARLRVDPVELQRLLETLAVGETQFWRNPATMDALATQVLPELLARARHRGRAGAPARLRVWSAGCATGEEAWSLAIMLDRLVPNRHGWDIEVLGTDLSTACLAAASAGRYTDRAVAGLHAQDRQTYLTAGPDNSWEVRDVLRPLVAWRPHNLVLDPMPFSAVEPVDLILCRNVMIYFTRQATRDLVARFHDCLVDGGVLVLGHSETLWTVSDALRTERISDVFFYRKLSPEPRTASVAELRTAPAAGSRTAPAAGSRVVRAQLPRPARRRERGRPPSQEPEGAGGPPANGATVRRMLGQGAYDAAERAASAMAAANPLAPEGHYLLALVLARCGRHPEALRHVRRAVYADPTFGFAHFLMATLLASQGFASEAARSYAVAARTLGGGPRGVAEAEWGGRDISELVDLCRRLSSETTAGPAPVTPAGPAPVIPAGPAPVTPAGPAPVTPAGPGQRPGRAGAPGAPGGDGPRSDVAVQDA